jgi:hypothetical protein
MAFPKNSISPDREMERDNGLGNMAVCRLTESNIQYSSVEEVYKEQYIL